LGICDTWLGTTTNFIVCARNLVHPPTMMLVHRKDHWSRLMQINAVDEMPIYLGDGRLGQ